VTNAQKPPDASSVPRIEIMTGSVITIISFINKGPDLSRKYQQKPSPYFGLLNAAQVP